MSDPQETTPQTAEEEVTQQTVEEPTGTTEAHETELQEPTAPEQESQEAAEPVVDWEKRYRDIESYKTQLEQERAADRVRIEQQQEALQILSGAVKAQADPLEAKRQALAEAYQTYDPQVIVAAQEDYFNARLAAAENATLEKSIRAAELQRSMEASKKYGNYTPDQLAETQRSLTPEKLAILRRFDEGGEDGLLDTLSGNRQKREAEAKEKARLNQWFGQGSGGTPPGGFEENPVPVIDWVDFVLLPEADRKDLKERGIRILNAPDS